MSISVRRITKFYGAQKALDDASFEIGAGEVVGFLGPNGAGKSTMMKILTCFIPPSSGDAVVGGFDTRTHSMEVRRRVGYLPEHNPLYLDLYVREHLDFVAGVHGLRDRSKRVDALVQRVGLGPEQHKRIGQLSKGYRQRVGLAQALIHDPQVLILDEPTSGLDPNQLVDIRALIKSLGREKTVMLSTHIMQEVEAICDRVIIIDKGRIVADDKASTLRGRQAQGAVLEVEFDRSPQANELLQVAGVLNARRKEGGTWLLAHPADRDIRPAIFEFAVQQGLKVLGMQRSERGLEEVFKELTGNR
ncbi:MAG: gliding motility-associated ABC transporter ATP-binding subunit GldA [Flavobacteriales bacterium]|jgi:ABC-2 type transport system ATP-binding protein|nr:MAG: gliding motility-associated ABC transporter ATP-binding subunit GldA [Flavobacteriales bacterium]